MFLLQEFLNFHVAERVSTSFMFLKIFHSHSRMRDADEKYVLLHEVLCNTFFNFHEHWEFLELSSVLD